MTNQMSNMDINGGGQRGYPPQGYPDSQGGKGHGPGYGGHGAYDDGYGRMPQGGQRQEYHAQPERTMTMPGPGSMPQMPPLQRADSMPPSGSAGPHGSGGRPSPQAGAGYGSDPRRPPQAQHNSYGDNSGYEAQDPGYGDVYDAYASDAYGDNQDYGADPQVARTSMPNFDNNMPPERSRGSFDQSMRPTPEQAQPGPRQTAQLNHAKSQPDLRQPQAAVFEMAGDIPSVPPVPQLNAYQPGYDQGRPAPSPAGSYQSMPSRGPSAPPGAMNGQAQSPMQGQPRNHPAPVRPGLMAGSMVRVDEKPPPVRNYGGIPHGQPPPQHQPPPQQQQQQPQQLQHPQRAQQTNLPPVPPPQSYLPNTPVTSQELEQLRQVIRTNPNDQDSAMKLAKRLIEAADVLVANMPDPKARAKARERYVMDAQKILKKLSNAQNAEAMFVMADSLGKGLFGNEPDNKEAFTLYQSAAKLGYAAAAYRTAVCCEIGHEEGGGTRKDPMKAVQWYKRAATLGDPPAMYKVGMILLKGLLGQPRNPREAVSWLKRAAERADAENPHALHELGLLYESAQPNDAIIRDEAYALELFHQAADLGYKFSQYRLGCTYEYGLMGCAIDPRLSIMWFSKAATQEEHQAELALSGWYLTGSEGVLGQSDTEAYLWARKAAVAGLAKAEYAMGYFTEVGIGVPVNMEDAKRWYWRAAGKPFPSSPLCQVLGLVSLEWY
jgi:TPR repeat protein